MEGKHSSLTIMVKMVFYGLLIPHSIAKALLATLGSTGRINDYSYSVLSTKAGALSTIVYVS